MKNSWATVCLGEICDVLDRLRKPITKRDRVSGEYPYYGATGILDYVADYIFEEPLILVGEDGAKWGSGEATAFSANGKYWVNNHAHVLRPHRNRLHDSWLTYFLNHQDLSPFVTGLTVPKLNQAKLVSIPIPLPPLAEQKRIVAILDEAFAAIERAKEIAQKNIANARELFEATLEKLFVEKGHGWREMPLSEIANITMGTSPPSSTYNTNQVGLPLINGPVEFGGQDAFATTTAIKYTTNPVKTCQKGDLILCVRGSTTGRMNVAGFDSAIGRGVAAIRPMAYHGWIGHYLAVSRTRIHSLGTGATFPNLTSDRLAAFPVPLPPVDELDRVLAQINSLNEGTKTADRLYQAKYQKLDSLKTCILHKAFTGQLTAKSPELEAVP